MQLEQKREYAMPFHAVIDTNVIISALISKKEDTATVKVIRAVLEGYITPLFTHEILEEYDEVLHRNKFHLREKTIQKLLTAFRVFGAEVFPKPTLEILPDMDDLVFYEAALEVEGAYLITGNMKHYPARDFIVSPADMMRILNDDIRA